MRKFNAFAIGPVILLLAGLHAGRIKVFNRNTPPAGLPRAGVAGYGGKMVPDSFSILVVTK